MIRVSQQDNKQGHGSGGEKYNETIYDLVRIFLLTRITRHYIQRVIPMTMTNGGKITETGYRRTNNNTQQLTL